MDLVVVAPQEGWHSADLRRAAAGDDRLQFVSYTTLAAWVAPGRSQQRSGEVDLAAADALLVRTMPAGTLEQVVFRMDVLGRVEAHGHVVVNPPRAIECAVDKYLATARLEAAGVRVPATFVCQSAVDALAAFDQLAADVVLKPLFGSEGRGIVRITDRVLAERAFRLIEQIGSVIYLQQFIPHEGFDLRILVAGERALAMRRKSQLDWRTNVSQGAQCEPFDPTGEQLELARRAAAATGTLVAGVDLLPGKDGQLYCLEVNAAPGWRALARTTGVDVARVILDHVEHLARQASQGD